MFITQNEKTYRMYFKHHRKQDKNGNKHPKATHCYIIDGDKVIAQGHAKPVQKIPYILKNNENAEILFGNKLIEVLRFDDKTKVAIIRGDTFNYKTGRIESAKKALMDSPIFSDQTMEKILNELQ